MSDFIRREQWKEFLNEFSKRNHLRPTRLEVMGEIGAQEEEEFLPFVGASFESKGSAAGSIEIILGGETASDQRPIEHMVPNVARIAPLIGPDGLEEGLGVEEKDGGKTLLIFKNLPEIPEQT